MRSVRKAWVMNACLDDREKRIVARQRRRLDRHANDGQRCHRRHHARQVRRAAGAGDDDADAAALGVARVRDEARGGAVRGDDGHLEGHAKPLEDLRLPGEEEVT